MKKIPYYKNNNFLKEVRCDENHNFSYHSTQNEADFKNCKLCIFFEEREKKGIFYLTPYKNMTIYNCPHSGWNTTEDGIIPNIEICGEFKESFSQLMKKIIVEKEKK